MSGQGKLLAVQVDGTTQWVPNTYEGVKAGMNQATIDGVRISRTAAYYIDDNGMLTGERLNIPASMLAGRALYGPVVLMHGDPDDHGNERPPLKQDADLLLAFCDAWRHILADMARTNQTFDVRANADTIPPPKIVNLTEKEFEEWLEGKRPS